MWRYSVAIRSMKDNFLEPGHDFAELLLKSRLENAARNFLLRVGPLEILHFDTHTMCCRQGRST